MGRYIATVHIIFYVRCVRHQEQYRPNLLKIDRELWTSSMLNNATRQIREKKERIKFPKN